MNWFLWSKYCQGDDGDLGMPGKDGADGEVVRIHRFI